MARVTASRTRVRFSSVPTSSERRSARAARSAKARIVRASASEKAFGCPDCRSKTPTTRSSRTSGTTSSERASRPADDVVRLARHVGHVHDAPRARGERNEARRVERDHGDGVDGRPPLSAPAVLDEDMALLIHEEEAAGLVAEVLRERVEDLVEENPPVGRAREKRVGRVGEASGFAHRLRDGVGRASLLERDAHEVGERLKRLDVVELDPAGRVPARDAHDADRLARRPHGKDAERTRPELAEPLLRGALRLLLDVVHDERLPRFEDAERDGRTFRRQGDAPREISRVGAAVAAETDDGVPFRRDEREDADGKEQGVAEPRERRLDDVVHRRGPLHRGREVEEHREPVPLPSELLDELGLLEGRGQVMNRRLEKRDVVRRPVPALPHGRRGDEPPERAVDADRDGEKRLRPEAPQDLASLLQVGRILHVLDHHGLELLQPRRDRRTRTGEWSPESGRRRPRPTTRARRERRRRRPRRTGRA